MYINIKGDYLVKHCIPLLRKKCAERRTHLVEVDMRWGITLNESTNGKTLGITINVNSSFNFKHILIEIFLDTSLI
jgi:hypothetical protein